MSFQGLWRDPEFLKLWSGQTISQIGSRITREGLPMTAVMVLNASPLDMGLLSGGVAAAVLLFGLLAGAWADRLRRRPLLIAADLGRALVLVTIPLAALYGRIGMVQLYIVAAIAGILGVLFDVAYQAYLPSLVDRENILEGNTKLAITESAAEVAGPGMTGILIQLLTAPIAILFDAISFVVSAISIAWIRRPEPRPQPHPDPHIGREIIEGLRLSWSDPVLRAMAGRNATAAFFGGFLASLYVLFAIRELGIKPAQLGLVVAVGGASSLAGAFLTRALITRFGVGPTYIGAAIFGGFSVILPAAAHGPVWLCCAFLIAAQLGDVAWPIANTSEVTLRQAMVPDSLLGRVNSAMLMLFRGMLPVGALTAGALAQVIGIRTTMFIGGAGFLLSALWLILSPIRRMRDLPVSAA